MRVLVLDMLCLQDMHVRAARKQLELLWRASASWGEHAQVRGLGRGVGSAGAGAGADAQWKLLVG